MERIVLKDLAYGTHERQRADVLIPAEVKATNGAIVFIHGGGWVEGDKSIHFEDAMHFCKLGYVSATINYRYVTEELTVFDELEDIATALAAIKAECTKYGLSLERVILAGGSAGAHLALLYAYTKRDKASVAPVAVCAYCPPVDCASPDFLMGISGEFEEWKYGVLSKCCGIEINKKNLLDAPQQEALKKISPQEHLSESTVPTAVFYAKKDELIPVAHIEKFLGLLAKNGMKSDCLIYENSGHALDKDPEIPPQTKRVIKTYAELYF